MLAGVRTVGCRRVGGGLAGEPAESNVGDGAALAASLDPDAIVFEGSGACIPPVEVDRTVCVVGAATPEPFAEYRLLRADLVLAADGAEAPPGALPFKLRPEPAEPLPGGGARGAVHDRRADGCDGVEPVVASTNLARACRAGSGPRPAAAERCDVYLTELKAAAIDTVAVRRARRGRPRDLRAKRSAGRRRGARQSLQRCERDGA